MLPTSRAEIKRARALVGAFVLEAYGPNRGLLGANLNEVANGLREFIKDEPTPRGRVVDGQPIDFIAPSFWHACCSVFFRWAVSRFAQRDGTSRLTIYRGQTNPWSLRPSQWRSPQPLAMNQSRGLEAFNQFLHELLPGDADPSYEFFALLDPNVVATLAQHHEFPTNLVDFTFDPLVALYFATRPSTALSPIAGAPPRCGVIFECLTSNLSTLRRNTNVAARYELPPPIHAARYYQQRGILIDCGPQNANSTPELDRACSRLFFPREYPEMPDLEPLFAEHMMAYWMSDEQSTWHTPQTETLRRQWYHAYHWYALPIEALRSYCASVGSDFNSAAAIHAMNETIKADRPPWTGYVRDFDAPARRAERLAEYFATAAAMIADVTKVFLRPNWAPDPMLLREYAGANPVLFAGLLAAAEKFKIYNLPEFKLVIEDSLGADVSEFADALSSSQREALGRLPCIWHEGDEQVRIFGSGR